MRLRIAVVLHCLLPVSACVGAAAHLKLDARTTLVFAPAATGREMLTARDAFVARLSPFDRAARLRTDRVVSEEDFLRHVGACVQEWTEPDRAGIAAAWAELQPQLEVLALPFPSTIHLISTNGKEEGGAAYTRGTGIALPPGDRTRPPPELAHLLAHELFHVLSRHAPALRDQLYACIGFQPCAELEFPATLLARKITNPDAPELRHCLEVMVEGRPVFALPILFAATETYDVARGGEFFDYLELKLLLVDPKPDAARTSPLFDGRNPRMTDVATTHGFLAQVGHNTQYIIHPEEILADNFALLVRRAKGLPSPEVVAKMRQVLAAAGQP